MLIPYLSRIAYAAEAMRQRVQHDASSGRPFPIDAAVEALRIQVVDAKGLDAREVYVQSSTGGVVVVDEERIARSSSSPEDVAEFDRWRRLAIARGLGHGVLFGGLLEPRGLIPTPEPPEVAAAIGMMFAGDLLTPPEALEAVLGPEFDPHSGEPPPCCDRLGEALGVPRGFCCVATARWLGVRTITVSGLLSLARHAEHGDVDGMLALARSLPRRLTAKSLPG